MVTEFKKTSGIDVSKDPIALQRLREAAEKTKIELSSTIQTEINLPYITADASGPKHLVQTLSRSQYENLVGNLIEKTIPPCEACLKDARVDKKQIDEVILVGGMTRTPKVIETVRRFYGKEPNRGVNPDEAVALGAAIQAAVLEGGVSDLILLDVTPLSLGIETLGGVFTRLIPRNTNIPFKKTMTFSTAVDGQTEVEIKVLQGERDIASQNKLLGSFNLVGIPPASKGVPKIDVTFDIDANGIVHVSARDVATGKEHQIRVQSSGGLSEDQIQQMIKDAEEHKETDRKHRELADACNSAENVIHELNKALDTHKDKIPAEEAETIRTEVNNLRSLVAQRTDGEAIKTKSTELQQQLFGITEKYIYNKQSSGDQGQSGSGDQPKGDSTQEADYRETK
jgi:molecular chaperone DnaK